MRLTHWSAEPLVDLVSYAQVGRPDMKPKGLWLSAKTDQREASNT